MFGFIILLSSYFISCHSANSNQWSSRTIYQLLTDRFAQTQYNPNGCNDLSDYCGGSWQGVINQLDYISGMGFDAIWISPFVLNTPNGYHGYWQQNFYEVNPNFGSESDLMDLVNEAHSRGMYVMMDVVANHVGPVGYNYSSIVPFNDPSHYHNCTICPAGCSISDWQDQTQVMQCRLAGLPDLDQENPIVTQRLTQWVKQVISTYSFDGLRIDTTPEVPKSFWQQYMAAAGVYAVGECENGDVGYVGGYQAPVGPLPGVLSYPLYFTLRNVFASQNSMYNLQTINQQYASQMPNPNLVGTFIDNHDNPRFLNQNSDLMLYKNAIVYTLMSSGIPIIYYGSEQGFSGGNDPANREVLWTSQYNTQSDLYQFIQVVVKYRKQAQVWLYDQVQRYADDNFYAFTRNDTFVAMTNGGSSQSQVSVTITYHPYQNGQKLCNLFWPTQDCITVEDGSFVVNLNNGECKIYYPV